MFALLKKLVLFAALVALPNCGKCCKDKHREAKEHKASHQKKGKSKKLCPGCGRHKCICFGDRK